MKDAEDIFRTIYSGTEESLRSSLLALKKKGYSQVETVKLLMSKLGMSLREADSVVLNSAAWAAEKNDALNLRNSFGQTLSDLMDKSVMDNFHLTIQGIASERVKRDLSTHLKYDSRTPFSSFVFFMYSGFHIPLNTNFFYLYEQASHTTEYKISCKVILATQGWGVLYHQIPNGHKSVCHVIFDEESYRLVTSKIPIVDTWTILNPNFVISTVPLVNEIGT